MLDILFIHPGASGIIYQNLSDRFAAIEPPTWSLLMAEACRVAGFEVNIIDCDAERLSDEEATKRVMADRPRLIVMPVYGSNPNAGTVKMVQVETLCKSIKDADSSIVIAVGGTHPSALPEKTLRDHSAIDVVLLGDGVFATIEIANKLKNNQYSEEYGFSVPGTGERCKQLGNIPVLHSGGKVVPQAEMDKVMPGYAWDLLPKKKNLLDMYRSCNWHADFKDEVREPYAAIYTSLGCRFKCSFCIINSINRETTDGDYDASKSSGMRFWSPDQMFNVVKHLYENGVRTIRLSDEMFFLDKRYFEPFLQKLADSGMGKDLQMWAYARVDTVRPKYLDLFYKAGVKWLALGIEAANTAVRREVTKGTFEETDIRAIVKQIQESGISVISNYIFGFPDDTYDTMNQTLDLALELNTEMANMYACSALPGSPLYRTAIENKWELPDNYAAWSFHSFESLPLPTKYLSAAEVLKFRDQSWNLYFNRPEYHKVVRDKFGASAEQHVKDMASIKLKRKIFES